MKKLIYGGLFLALVGIVLTSCEKINFNNGVSSPSNHSNSSTNKVAKSGTNDKSLLNLNVVDSFPDSKLIERATNYLTKNSIDVTPLKSPVSMITPFGKSIIFSSSNELGESEKVAVYFDLTEKAVNTLTTTTIKNSQYEDIITYYDSKSHEMLLQVEINSNFYSTKVIFVNPKLNYLNPGQRAINCINDAYSNHGWFSFGLWVGTILDPGIGIAVAAGCAIGAVITE